MPLRPRLCAPFFASLLALLAGTALALTSPAHAASTTFGFSAADSPMQSFSISDDDVAHPGRNGGSAAGFTVLPSPQDTESGDGNIVFVLHGGNANVGLTQGAAKTIHVGSGYFPNGAGDAQFDGESLPHTLSLTGTVGTFTQTLPQTDDLACSGYGSNQHLTVDIQAGPTVTFDMGVQGRIDVTPQEYTYDLDTDTNNSAPKFAYTLLLRAPAVTPSSVTVSPSSVVYPASATGTVTLTKAAPDAETVVLTSSNPAAASVPTTVMVAAGQQTLTFPITTSRVDSDTAVTISAAAGGTTKSVTFTVKTRPAVSFTYSIAGQPHLIGKDSQGDTVTFSATGGSGTVKLALGQRYTITAGSYTVTGSAGSDPGPSLETTVSRAVMLDSQMQTLQQALDESASEDEFDNEEFGAGLGDSRTLVYDLGTKGRVEISATGFSVFHNSDGNDTVPAQYTFVLLPPASATGTYYVSPSGSDDNPGTQAAPLLTIQQGIYYAGSSGIVILEDGVYSGTGDVALGFGGLGITVTSVDGAAKTVLDCGGSNEGFLFNHGETAAAVNGLTIKNGSVQGSFGANSGGAIAVGRGSQAAITNCVLSGSTAFEGGGVYNGGTLTLSACTLTGNTATYEGGSIYNDNSGMLTLDSCTLTGNMASEGGGGVYSQGTATLSACAFNGNTTPGFGGGGVESEFGSTTITNCSFVGNAAQYGGAGVESDGNLTLGFCTFADNTVAQQFSSSTPLGAAVDDEARTASDSVTDCIFTGDMSPGGPEIVTGGAVTYSDVQGGYAGTGNFSADPVFVHNPAPDASPPYYGDLRLQSGSPCIGQGIAISGVTTDRDGKPRADPPSVGALEYLPTPALSSLSPSSAAAGGPAFTITVIGTGFATSSIVKWNGAELTTTFMSSTKLTASVPASLSASAGTASVSVTTPKVATTAAKTFTITAAVTVTMSSLSLSPTSVKGGSATSTGTITLTGPAPAGGLAVKQTSSDTSSATLAPTLNILAGATSAKFKITTYAVANTQTVTITSSVNGTSKTAMLTVTH